MHYLEKALLASLHDANEAHALEILKLFKVYQDGVSEFANKLKTSTTINIDNPNDIALPSLNATDSEGNTPLLLSVKQNLTTIVEKLLIAKVDNTIVNKQGESALMLALNQTPPALKCISLLCNYSRRIAKKDPSFHLALVASAKMDNPTYLEKIINGEGSHKKIYHPYLRETLFIAAEKGFNHCVENLVMIYNHVFTNDDLGQALIYATKNNHADTIRILSHLGANINFCNSYYPLFISAHNNDIQAVKFLLEKGANPLQELPSTKETALHHALKNNHNECTKAILNSLKFAAYKVCDNENKTPLHYAAAQGKVHFLKKIINLGFDITIKDNHGKRAIDYASGDYSYPRLTEKTILKARSLLHCAHAIICYCEKNLPAALNELTLSAQIGGRYFFDEILPLCLNKQFMPQKITGCFADLEKDLQRIKENKEEFYVAMPMPGLLFFEHREKNNTGDLKTSKLL